MNEVKGLEEKLVEKDQQILKLKSSLEGKYT